MKISKAILGALGAIAVAGVATVNANQITGTIGFTSGTGGATQSGGTTSIHFTSPFSVQFGSDDYSGTVGQSANFTDFSFTGSGTSASLSGSVIPEWTFSVGSTTYSFDLLHLMSGTFTPGKVNAFSLQGTGIAHITGFDGTDGSFSIQGTGTKLTFAFLGASTTAVPVPDGGSALALLGLGLVAIEAVRRKLATS